MGQNRVQTEYASISKVLAALWNNKQRSEKVSEFQKIYRLPKSITPEEMQAKLVTIGNCSLNIHWAFVQSLLEVLGLNSEDFKANMSSFDPTGYNKLNGTGLAERVIANLVQNDSVRRL